MKFSEIYKELDSKARNATQEMAERGKTEILDRELEAYYGGGFPRVYERTRTLAGAGMNSNASGGAGNYNADIYMNQGISYSTGTYSGAQVIDATDKGHSRTVGAHGYWGRFESQLEGLVDSIGGKYFG